MWIAVNANALESEYEGGEEAERLKRAKQVHSLLVQLVPRVVAAVVRQQQTRPLSCSLVWYGDTPFVQRASVVNLFKRECSVQLVTSVRAYPQMLANLLRVSPHPGIPVFVLANFEDAHSAALFADDTVKENKCQFIFYSANGVDPPEWFSKAIRERVQQCTVLHNAMDEDALMYGDNDGNMCYHVIPCREVVEEDNNHPLVSSSSSSSSVSDMQHGSVKERGNITEEQTNKSDDQDVRMQQLLESPSLCCPVCREALIGAVLLIPCGHSVCLMCDQNKYEQCPVCMLTVSAVVENYSTRSFVEQILGVKKCQQVQEKRDRFRQLKREWKEKRLRDIGDAVCDVLERTLVCSIQRMFDSVNELLETWNKPVMCNAEYACLCHRMCEARSDEQTGMDAFRKAHYLEINDRALWVFVPGNSEMLSNVIPRIERHCEFDDLHRFLLARTVADSAHRTLLYDICEPSNIRNVMRAPDCRDDWHWMSSICAQTESRKRKQPDNNIVTTDNEDDIAPVLSRQRERLTE